MLSLLLASHNGSETLPRTLSALGRLEHPPQGLEVIAIDNASTDDTRQILRSYLDKLPMTVLYEPRQGKSFALNKGIEHAKGNLIVFTDDDIIPEVNWLMTYVDAAERYPEVGIFAGQVRHQWDAPPPDWLKYLADLGKSYGGTPVDLHEQTISAGLVKGCNLMVRRTAMAGTRFSEATGVNFSGQGPSAGGEDTLFAREVAANQNDILFVPAACVRHIVRVDEVGIKPVFSRYLRIGSTQPLEAKGGVTIFGYPGWGLRLALGHAGKCLSSLICGKSNEASLQMVYLAKSLGGLRQGHRIRNTLENDLPASKRDRQ